MQSPLALRSLHDSAALHSWRSLRRVVRPGISSSSSILVDGTLASQSARAVPRSAGRCQLAGIGTCAARVSVDLTTPCRIRSVDRCFFNVFQFLFLCTGTCVPTSTGLRKLG